jgi:histidinol-phosphate aminotransferase
LRYCLASQLGVPVRNILSARLRERSIRVKPLEDARLGPGDMRVTTALPEGNVRVIEALRELL